MSRKYFMLVVDIVLLLLLVVLNSPLFTGLLLHEQLGIFFVLPLFMHLLLSWQWINRFIRHFIIANIRNKLNFLLLVILFILCILEISSGLIISRSILPRIGISTINDWKWRALHNQISVGLIILVSIHIAVNWKRFISYCKRKLAGTTNKLIVFKYKHVHILLIRSFVLVTAALIFVLMASLLIGAPSTGRLYMYDDVQRLEKSLVWGYLQLIGMTTAIVLLIALTRQLLSILMKK